MEKTKTKKSFWKSLVEIVVQEVCPKYHGDYHICCLTKGPCDHPFHPEKCNHLRRAEYNAKDYSILN